MFCVCVYVFSFLLPLCRRLVRNKKQPGIMCRAVLCNTLRVRNNTMPTSTGCAGCAGLAICTAVGLPNPLVIFVGFNVSSCLFLFRLQGQVGPVSPLLRYIYIYIFMLPLSFSCVGVLDWRAVPPVFVRSCSLTLMSILSSHDHWLHYINISMHVYIACLNGLYEGEDISGNRNRSPGQ